MNAGRQREPLWPYCSLIVMAGLAAYADTFSAPLVFDGVYYIKRNASLGQLWPWHYTLGLNRPVGFFTFGLNYVCNGTQLWGYHIVNLAIHLAAALVLFGLVRRTLLRAPLAARYGDAAAGLAFAVALLWMLHPLQTESVTYVYQRLESLMGLFYLLTLYGFVRAQQSPRPAAWYAMSVVCCAAGMGTKEAMVTAPVLVLWYDRALVATSWRELFARRAPYYAALACTWGILAVLMIANFSVSKGHGVLVVENVSPLSYLLTQSGVILRYLRLSFWPVGQCLDYAWPQAVGAWQIVPPGMAILALLAIVAWAVWRRPAWGFVGACFFVILAPTSSIAPTADVAVEHRMYLPLAAVVLVVVIGGFEIIRRLAGRRQRFAGALALLLVAGALGTATFERNRLYGDELALWTDVVEKSPANARAWVQLGNSLSSAGQNSKAIQCDDQALTLLRKFAPVPAYYADAYLGRGNAHSRSKDPQAAIEDYTRAIEYRPEFAEAFYNRGVSLAALEKWPEAIADYDRALEINPSYLQAYANRANVNQTLGRWEQSLSDLDRAIGLAGDNAILYANRARLLAVAPLDSVRNGQQAVEDASRACELSGWRFAPALDALAAAQAENGDFEQALLRQQQAIELAAGNPQFQEAARARLELYRAGKPFRQSP